MTTPAMVIFLMKLAFFFAVSTSPISMALLSAPYCERPTAPHTTPHRKRTTIKTMLVPALGMSEFVGELDEVIVCEVGGSECVLSAQAGCSETVGAPVWTGRSNSCGSPTASLRSPPHCGQNPRATLISAPHNGQYIVAPSRDYAAILWHHSRTFGIIARARTHA